MDKNSFLGIIKTLKNDSAVNVQKLKKFVKTNSEETEKSMTRALFEVQSEIVKT